MYKRKRILGLIPARGGSKGLPKKNIFPFLKKPLIAWTIEQALKSKYLDDVVVSTDDESIRNVAARCGAQAPFLRPKKFATDKAKSIDVILHALDFLRNKGQHYDYLMLLEPTSPLRETRDIDRALELLIDNKVGARAIVGVSKVETVHPAFLVKANGRGFLKSYNNYFSKLLRRQDVSALYFLEGSVYASHVGTLKKKRGFLHEHTLPYIVPRWKSLEIDEYMDLVCAEAILKNITKIKDNSHHG